MAGEWLQYTFLGEHTFSKGVRSDETEKYGTMFRENDRFFRFSTLE